MLSINRSLVGAVRHVYSRDPALDKDHKDYSPALFRDTGDLKHMPPKEGQRVAVFELKPLPRRRLNRITSAKPADGDFTAEQYNEAVAYGLKAVRDFEVDGAPVELHFDGDGADQRLREKSLDAIYKLTLFIELGSRILEISDLSF